MSKGKAKAVETPRAHGHAEPNSRPITDAEVRALTLPEGKNKMILNDAPNGPRDKSFVPGFGVRISSGGAKTFILRYRADGRDRLVRIGPYGAWSVVAARRRPRSYGGRSTAAPIRQPSAQTHMRPPPSTKCSSGSRLSTGTERKARQTV